MCVEFAVKQFLEADNDFWRLIDDVKISLADQKCGYACAVGFLYFIRLIASLVLLPTPCLACCVDHHLAEIASSSLIMLRVYNKYGGYEDHPAPNNNMANQMMADLGRGVISLLFLGSATLLRAICLVYGFIMCCSFLCAYIGRAGANEETQAKEANSVVPIEQDVEFGEKPPLSSEIIGEFPAEKMVRDGKNLAINEKEEEE